jgi:transposase-like protein
VAQSKRSKLLPQARALYAEGASKAAIAESLGVAPSTVRRWARRDAQAGRPWQRGGQPPPPPRRTPAADARPGHSCRADRLCRRLEERLERLIEAGESEPGSARLEDRMLKVCRVLEHLRGGQDELRAQLESMKRFAGFCTRTLTEEEMGPVRKAVRLFLEDLRREHS